jgi:predicted flap endonuclease-1-like 5' DNA nuclease
VRSEALRGDAAYYAPSEIDDLKRIRGIGVLIEKKLNSLGITSYEQVANWTSADIARISQMLDFVGRIERENWVEQARILASGGQTEFSRRADRGEV